MITFKLSFLIAFNLKVLTNSVDNNEGKKSKSKRLGKPSRFTRKYKGSEKSRTESKKSAKQKSNKDTDMEQEMFDPTVVNVTKPIGYLHCEYELIPKRFTYNFDVICWERAAKIYTTNGYECVKPIIKDNIAYVPVFIEHYANHFTTLDLLAFLETIITFNFTTDYRKLGKEAKSDKCHCFFMKKEDVDKNNEFVDLFMENPNCESTECEQNNLKEFTKNMYDCANFPSKNEITTWIHYKNNVHCFQMNNIIKRIFMRKDIESNEFIIAVKENGTERRKKVIEKKKKTKKSIKLKDNTNVIKNLPVYLKIPAEILFTDPIYSLYQLNEGNLIINKVFVLLSCDNLLTQSQIVELNPLILKISKISNLPKQRLSLNNIEKIFIKSHIDNLYDLKTPIKSVQETVKFKYARFICTNKMNQLRLLEFIRNEHLHMEIVGIKEEVLPVKIKSSILDYETEKKKSKNKGKKEKKIKGSNTFKKSKSSKSSKSSIDKKSIDKKILVKTEELVIAVANYNLSSLMANDWIFLEKGQCHEPLLFLHSPYNSTNFFKNEDIIDRLTINEINLVRSGFTKSSSPLTEELLLTNATNLKVEVRFLAPQYNSVYSRGFVNTFKRLFLIIFNLEETKTFLNTILLHNQEIMGPEVIVPNLTKNIEQRHDSDWKRSFENVLTGFMLDAGDHSLLFVEGLSNGVILKLCLDCQNYNLATAKVFYNSDDVFEHRLYFDLIRVGGFYTVSIKLSIREIFEKPEIYLTGNMPSLCWRAVKKLQLIYHSFTFNSILHFNLLPTLGELFSFCFEYALQPRHMDSSHINAQLQERRSTTIIWRQASLPQASNTDLFGDRQRF